MANTTFNGPVRSENGFDTIIKNASTGALTSDMKLSTYSTSITFAASGTEHKTSINWHSIEFHSDGSNNYYDRCNCKCS